MRPRGRPQRLPYDNSTARSERPDGNKRLAWLLATSRLLTPAAASYSRAGFANVLHDAGLSADPSRISRWEAGTEALPQRLVRAYEQACGLGPHSLDLVRRMLTRTGYATHRPAANPAPDAPDPTRIDVMVDNMSAGQADGLAWLDFVDEIDRYDRVYMHRKTWTEITSRLVDELSRAQGLAGMRRYEAAAALVADDRSRTYLSKSIGKLALTPNHRLVLPALHLLGEIGTPAASTLVLRLLDAREAALRSAASIVAASMVLRGRMDAAATELERYVGTSLVHTDHADRPPSVALTDLAVRLDDDAFDRVVSATPSPQVRQALVQVYDSHELIAGDVARMVSDRIALQSETTFGRQTMDPDLMLRALIREALCHVSRERRHVASHVLAVSPFGPAVADGLLEITEHADDHLARLAWLSVRRLAGVVDQDRLVHRVMTESRPHLRNVAILSLVGSPSPIPGNAVDQLAGIAADGRAPYRDVDATIVALALMGHTNRISGAARGSDDDTGAWWTALRGAIHE